MSQFQQEFVATAIEHYGLELEQERVDTVILTWFGTYDPAWVVKALVEALYRGRYKVKSVDNILRDWQRRGSPLYKFTPDYEREILHSLRLNTDTPSVLLPSAIPTPTEIPARQISVDPQPLPDLARLDPEETAPFEHHERSKSATQLGSEEDLSSSAPELPPPDKSSIDRHRYAPPAIPDLGSIEIESATPPAKLYLFHKLREIVDPQEPLHQNIQQSVRY
jgi:hypothetical protein